MRLMSKDVGKMGFRPRTYRGFASERGIMPILRNLVKRDPLATRSGRCICGLRQRGGKCNHCDNPCDQILRDPKGCKRCAKNVTNFLHKEYIRQQYFAIIDEEIEKGLAQIRDRNSRNDRPDFLRPEGDC